VVTISNRTAADVIPGVPYLGAFNEFLLVSIDGDTDDDFVVSMTAAGDGFCESLFIGDEEVVVGEEDELDICWRWLASA
jgi:hypothetical protein